MINIFQPRVGDDELAKVKKVFESNWLGRGGVLKEFKEKFAKKLQGNPEHFEPISTCTEGLFQAVRLVTDPAEPCEIILPSISFVGAANAIVNAGAKPVFCDVDPDTMNVTLKHIKERVTDDTKAIILIHYGGRPCDDIFKIVDWAHDNDVYVIEDNANSPFSWIMDGNDRRHTGTIGDIGLWSFDAMKILCTGDGGMFYTKYPQWMSHLQRSIYLGMDKSSGFSSEGDSWWKFNVLTDGRRAIMNDISAAIGVVQLDRVDGFIVDREIVVETYNGAFGDVEWISTPPLIPDTSKSSYYLYPIQLPLSQFRDDFATYLKANGVYTTFRYYPLHRIPFYNHDGFELPNTEYLANHTICLPLHQSLSIDDVNYITDTCIAYG